MSAMPPHTRHISGNYPLVTPSQLFERMERETGIEPATNSLEG